MNITSSALPTAALAHEAQRPAPQPTQETSRPVVAPNPSEAMAQEMPRETGSRNTQQADRKVEHESSSTDHRTRRSHPGRDTASSDTPRSANNAGNHVGTLLDVFA